MPRILGGICDGSSISEGKCYKAYLIVVPKWSGNYYIYHFDTPTGDYLFEECMRKDNWGTTEKRRYRTAAIVVVDYGEEETVNGKIPTLVVVDMGAFQ